MHTCWWNSANVIFSWWKSNTWETYSAPKLSDYYHQKMQAIRNMHLPKTPKQVHAFLGLVGYYRKFIRNFEKIAKPLTLLTCQPAKFEWDTNPITMLFNTQGISHPSTNITLSQSKEILHSLYRCIRWCLWSTAISRTWWNRNPQ